MLSTSVRLFPSHQLELYPGWGIWRCVALRSAGFPMQGLLRLSFPELVGAEERLLAAEKECDEARERALTKIREELDKARDDSGRSDPHQRKALLKAMDRAKRDRPPQEAPSLPASLIGAEGVLTVVAQQRSELAEARSMFQRVFDNILARQALALHEVAGQEHFCEAVLWQNHRAYHSAVLPVASQAPTLASQNAQRRRCERLVANYLQRYSAKNDTIGFFGPVGWAHWREEGDSLELFPGAGLIDQRQVFFESWGIAELASTLSAIEGVRPWLSPEVPHYVKLEDSMIHVPMAPPIPLSQLEADALELCRGRHTAREIAVQLLGEEGEALSVYRLLGKFAARGIISWGFYVPPNPQASEALWKQINGIEDDAIRRACAEPLEKLEEARRNVAAAAGDASRLDHALGELQTMFTRLTGKAATRFEGETYAARTLLYEDCRRDVDVRLGPELLQAIGRPISLYLQSVRWVTVRVAERFHQAAKEIYTELAASGQEVGVLSMQARLLPLFHIENLGRWLGPVFKEFQDRWSKILNLHGTNDPATQQLLFRSEELRESVEEEFAAAHPGWREARCHSIDLMIAAADAEAVQRGEFRVVLGDVHVSVNNLNNWLFMSQHPDREEALRHVAQDMPGRLIAISPEQQGIRSTRNNRIPHPDDTFLVSPPNSGEADTTKWRQLSPHDLCVVEGPSGLEICSRDGQFQLSLIEATAPALARTVLDSCSLPTVKPHQPRILFDDLVVTRESWAFVPEELDFATLKDPTEIFLAVRGWARSWDMPRFVFVQVPIESKPFFVDLSVPVYIDHLVKVTRKMRDYDRPRRWVHISEMLPSPQELWLEDGEGQQYTSEFRTVILDQRHPPKGDDHTSK